MKIDPLALLQRMKVSRLRFWAVLLSVLASEAIVSVMGLLLKGEVSADYLLTGLVTSAFVASLLVAVVGFFLEKLAENQIRLHTIIEAEPECVKLLAADGTLLQINRAGLNMIEADSEEQVLGLTLVGLVSQPYREAFLALNERVNRGETGTLEFEIIGLKGGHRWLETHAVPMRDRENRITGLLAVSRDVTGRRQSEDELRRAKAEAEAANMAKSRFLATVSHEIRTPMNGILGMAQLLMMPSLTDTERQDYARTVLNSGQTLLSLINDILDITKVEAGKFALESTAFEPGQVIHEVRALFLELAGRKGLTLGADWFGPAGQRYLGDPYRLRQMLSNLVGNALKFTAQGQIRVEAREVACDGQTATLEFAVVDSGIGIAEDKQQLLFEPFSQADSSTTRQFGGSGLGLSIVRGLARLMGGDVGVDSEPGRGSLFWFRVRADRIAAGEESRHMPRPTGPEAAALSPQLSGRVLVVEDNLTNRKLIEALLKKLGLTVALVEDGQQAIEAVAAGDTADLILMDLQMPVMDGYAATEAIRRWEAENGRSRRPIVALTADAFEEDRRHCQAVGMDDFLTKPISIDTLTAMLSRWLEAAHASGEKPW